VTYVGGNEQAFRGFGAQGPRSPFGATPEGPTGIPDIDKPITSGVSSLLDRVAAGIDTKHVPDAFKRANGLVKKYAGTDLADTKTKRRMLEFFYLQARSGLSGILQNEYAKAATSAVATGMQVGGYVKNIVEKFKTDEPIDSSGITDIAGMSHKITGSLVGFLRNVGAIDAKLAGDINAWSAVAVGCASAVGAIGPYAGAASCALQFANRLITQLSRETPKPAGPAAIFVPTKEQVFVAATDAIRLASILRYQYRIPSWAQLYNNNIYPGDAQDPASKFLRAGSYPTLDEKLPLVAVDMRTALAIMRFNGFDAPGSTTLMPPQLSSVVHGDQHGTGNPWLSTRHILYKIGSNELAGDCGRGTYDREIYDSYVWDHDVDVQCIDFGAKLYKQFPQTARVGLDAFKRVYELINFFTALTIQELQTGQKIINVYTNPVSARLPVRLYAVSDEGGTDCRDDFYDEECQAAHKYGSRCWTSLNRCHIPTNDCYNEKVGLHAKMMQGDMCALRQVGAIRLMAAFSYLHMSYMRGHSMGQALPNRDILASLAPENDPGVATQLPVKIYDMAWVTTIQARMKKQLADAKAIRTIAFAQAKADYNAIVQMNVSGWNPKTATHQATVTGPDLFLKHADKLSANVSLVQQCKNAGGIVTYEKTSAGTDKLVCKKPSSGSVAPVLLAGAALAALALLRK